MPSKTDRGVWHTPPKEGVQFSTVSMVVGHPDLMKPYEITSLPVTLLLYSLSMNTSA
jgi:hypothetical protein